MMLDLMRGQNSLTNFYRSVGFQNPRLAADIHEDVIIVGLGALAEDKSPAQDAAERLRRVAMDLPVIQARVLNHALEDLGYTTQ